MNTLAGLAERHLCSGERARATLLRVVPRFREFMDNTLIQAFIEEFKIGKEEPTWQVCKRLNKPHTALHKCSGRT